MGFSCEFCENFLIQFAIEIISLYNNHGREPKEEIMTQKHKALSSSLTIVTLLTCFTTAAITSPIRAEGESEADVKPTIRLEINDLNAADKIKTALFQEAAVSVPAEETTLMAPAADLTNAEIKIDQLDLSKIGQQDVMVHLTLNNTAAQNSLLQTTLSREVTLDIQDTTAPVIELKYPHIRLEYVRNGIRSIGWNLFLTTVWNRSISSSCGLKTMSTLLKAANMKFTSRSLTLPAMWVPPRWASRSKKNRNRSPAAWSRATRLHRC